MNATNWKRAGLGAMAGAALALGACTPEAPAPVAVEGVYPNLEITDARLVLPPVAGNPAAVYFNAVFNGERGISITGAEVAGASSAQVHAMMEYDFEMTMAEAGPIPLRRGESQAFEPGGLHVMAMELDEKVKPGDTVEVTLKIIGGKTHTFDAEVRAAGEDR